MTLVQLSLHRLGWWPPHATLQPHGTHLFSFPSHPTDLAPEDMWAAPLQVIQFLVGHRPAGLLNTPFPFNPHYRDGASSYLEPPGRPTSSFLSRLHLFILCGLEVHPLATQQQPQFLLLLSPPRAQQFFFGVQQLWYRNENTRCKYWDSVAVWS